MSSVLDPCSSGLTQPLQYPVNTSRQHNGGPDFIGELALLIDMDRVALQSETDGHSQTTDSSADDDDVQRRCLMALSHCATGYLVAWLSLKEAHRYIVSMVDSQVSVTSKDLRSGLHPKSATSAEGLIFKMQ